jgi:uncharacterized membrane protein YfcA
VIPVYLQVVVGLNAFETGKRLLPLSIAMLLFALLGPRMASRRSPRTVARLGLVAVALAALLSLWFTRRLPTESLTGTAAAAAKPLVAA